MQKMREQIEAMKEIWTKSTAEYNGEIVKVPSMMTWPKPVQKPYPPILLGGAFPWAARRAIRYGDGWYPNASSGNPEEYMPRFRQMAVDAGRDPQSLPVTIGGAPEDADRTQALPRSRRGAGQCQPAAGKCGSDPADPRSLGETDAPSAITRGAHGGFQPLISEDEIGCRSHRWHGSPIAPIRVNLECKISLLASQRLPNIIGGDGREKRVPRSSAIGNSAPSGLSPGSTTSASQLGQAITALRRGDPVLIRDDRLSVLAIAAELVSEEKLRRLRQVSTFPPRIVLTRRRAVALGLAQRDELSGAVTISVSSEMPAAVIRNLADPGASLGAEPPGFGPEPVVAKSGGLAAVTLAKLAALLPAALVVRVGAAERHCWRDAAISWRSTPPRCFAGMPRMRD